MRGKEKAKIKIDVLTLFPEMFEGPLTESMLKRAREKGIIEVAIHNIRDFTTDKHRITDDAAYGSGGMILKPEPLFRAVEFLKKAAHSTAKLRDSKVCRSKVTVILMTPAGNVFSQQMAKDLARRKHLILICGHYEGIDERIREIVDEEVSIGDYVLTGGEIPAMAVIDATARMIKGVVGRKEAPVRDSFYNGILDHPHYTRPAEFEGMQVPEILLSGNHKKIEEWRQKMALKRTKQRRPDLLK